MNLPDIVGKVRIDNTQGKAALSEMGSAADVAGKSAVSMGDKFKGAAIGFAAVATAATAAVVAMKGLVMDFAKAGSELVDLNKQLGIGVVEIQKLQFAAKQTGVEFGAVTTGLMQMEKAASKSPEKFAQLGISFGQLRTSKPDELLSLIAKGLNGVSDQNEKARIAMELFGRGGSQMLKMLTEDFEGLKEEAKDTGLMTEEMAKRADRLGDAADKLDDVIAKLKINLGAAFASPGMIRSMEGMATLMGLMARHADKIYTALKLFGGGAGLILQGMEAIPGGESSAGASAATGGGGGYRPGKGFAATTKALSDADKAFAKLLKHIDDLDAKAAKSADARVTKESKAAEQSYKAWEKFYARFDNDKMLSEWAAEQGAKNRSFLPYIERDTMAPYAGMPSGLDNSKMMSEWAAEQKKKNLEGLKGLDDHILKTTSNTIDWSRALGDVSNAFQALGLDASNVLVSITAQLAGAFAAAQRVTSIMGTGDKKKKWSELNGEEKGAVGMAGLQTATSAYASGSVLGGAAGGAAFGASFGPWGAAIGGAVGGILGLFGGKAKEKKELAELKGQLEGMRDTAKGLGVDLTAAFASKSINEVKAAIEAVNKAAADKEKRVAGISTFTGGMNQWAQGGGISDQASADRAGRFAMFSFGNQVKESGDIFGALDAIGPTLEAMAKSAKEFGLEMPKGVESLLQLNGLDEGIKAQVSGLNAMTKGIGESGLMTKELFADLGAEAVATRAKLAETGLSGAQSMAIMQPSLQQLYEAQKLHGYAVDETTQALLDEAKAQGVVGDQFMSANERMVELLGILVETLGGKLPESYKRAGDAAEEYGRRATSSMPTYPNGGGTNPGDSGDGTGWSQDEGHASGTSFRNYGSGTRTILHGEEAVLTRPQMDRLVGMAVSGSAPAAAGWGGGDGGSGGKIVIELGGQRVGEALYTMSRKGQLKIDQKAVTRR